MVILSVPILLVVIVDYFLVAINVYSVDDYFLRGYWCLFYLWLLMFILFVAIGGYWWLLVVIVLMVINGYCIGAY